MTWKELGNRIFGNTNESVDGEWQWGDLLNPASMINGIFGSDQTESTSNGKFDFTDLFYYKGAKDWAEKNLGVENLDPRENIVNGIGDIANSIKPGFTDQQIPLTPQGNENASMRTPEPNYDIQDKTDENIEQNISGTGNESIFEYMEQQQKKQWEREDLIRAETQEREDTAYQRAVKDMQAAGINPNLMTVSPAASGGGITTATGINYTPWETVMKEQLTLLQQEIDNNFKGDENAKDRLIDIIGKIANLYMLGGVLKGKGGK